MDDKIKAAMVGETAIGLCPKCGHTIGYDPHFKRPVCCQCGWMGERAQADDNPPLTLEELRGMDGESVYLINMEPVEYGWQDQYALIDIDEDVAYNGSFKFDLSECVGFAYRRKPEGGGE